MVIGFQTEDFEILGLVLILKTRGLVWFGFDLKSIGLVWFGLETKPRILGLVSNPWFWDWFVLETKDPWFVDLV